MFGIIQAIFSAGVVLNDKLTVSNKTATSRNQAFKNGEKTYIDGKGNIKYTGNNKSVPITAFGGERQWADYYDCRCDRYWDENKILRIKKKIYGIMDYKVATMYEELHCDKVLNDPIFHPQNFHLNLFDEFFLDWHDAHDYGKKKYGEKKWKKYKNSVDEAIAEIKGLDLNCNMQMLYVPQEEYYEHTFEKFINAELDPEIKEYIEKRDNKYE